MNSYKRLNIVFGWVAFLIALITYLLTLEPTTSLWDCGEFIASAYKLEVGHPPGAPFYMILARFFSLFAGDVTRVAVMINSVSALSSAFTILFLFWSITHLAQKIVIHNEEYSPGKTIAIIGAGLTGAMAYTFSDTFWFSAVEAEVYATSSLFTALVFWAILKWENEAGKKYSLRWIILIAYLMGLSIGVHLLNLLAIPAIVFVYYFKNYEATRNGILKAAALSIILLGIIMYGIIPGVIKVASWFELFFVNGFGLPYNTGVIIYIILLLGLVVWGLYKTYMKRMAVLNTIILAFTVILISYSSFSMIVIRSLANPPMDENNPDNVFALLSYLNREQYGDRPLFYGQYYSAPEDERSEGKPTYAKLNGKYEVVSHKTERNFNKEFTTLFPRMYSDNPDHVNVYKKWGNIKGKPIRYQTREGKWERKTCPTFGENLRFFFSYQLGHMYFRYFMWNFAGKQNDTQNQSGDLLNGNWISGIKAFDAWRLGPQDDIPAKFKNQPSRNTYFLLPLILGILGLLYHSYRKSKDFWVVMLLFFFTGIAIVVYLNQSPNQPRERDYAYAGSFYAFSVWIGLGVLAIYENLNKWIKKALPAAITASVISLVAVPAVMAKENWDDHDRSGRYTARDYAYNYLNSCAPNSILLTIGDNDTFPLWYAQEVEGIRTDVRVVNMMLFNTQWYIEQMVRKAYDSEPIPVSLDAKKYQEGKNHQIYLFPRIDDYIDLRRIMEFINSDAKETQLTLSDNTRLDYIPAQKFKLLVDTQKVVQNGTVDPSLKDKVVPEINWEIKRNALLKNQMMLLDVLATNEWNRPVYFISGNQDDALALEAYFQLEGFAYRFVPIQTPRENYLNYGRVATDIMYDNIMNKFRWGRMNEPDFNMDHYVSRTVSVLRFRNNFVRLANALMDENKTEKALEILDKCVELTPVEKIPYDIFSAYIIEAYYRAGETEKADTLLSWFRVDLNEEINYYGRFPERLKPYIQNDLGMALRLYQEIVRISGESGNKELRKEMEEEMNMYYSRFFNNPPR